MAFSHEGYTRSILTQRIWLFKQSTAAGVTTAAMTEKVWGEYISVRSLNFKFSETKYKETRAKEFKTSFI